MGPTRLADCYVVRTKAISDSIPGWARRPATCHVAVVGDLFADAIRDDAELAVSQRTDHHHADVILTDEIPGGSNADVASRRGEGGVTDADLALADSRRELGESGIRLSEERGRSDGGGDGIVIGLLPGSKVRG